MKLSGKEFSQWLQSVGIPPGPAELLSYLDVQIGSAGIEDRLNTVVKDVTGKEPENFRAYAEATKNVWL